MQMVVPVNAADLAATVTFSPKKVRNATLARNSFSCGGGASAACAVNSVLTQQFCFADVIDKCIGRVVCPRGGSNVCKSGNNTEGGK